MSLGAHMSRQAGGGGSKRRIVKNLHQNKVQGVSGTAKRLQLKTLIMQNSAGRCQQRTSSHQELAQWVKLKPSLTPHSSRATRPRPPAHSALQGGGPLVAPPRDLRACGEAKGQRLWSRHGGAVSNPCRVCRESFSASISVLSALSRRRHWKWLRRREFWLHGA